MGQSRLLKGMVVDQKKKPKHLSHVLLPFFNVAPKFLNELCKFIHVMIYIT